MTDIHSTEKTQKYFLHHANILVGKKDRRTSITDFIKKNLDFDVIANPDFLPLDIESFGIKEARYLERWIGGKPLLGEVKVSLIMISSITSEAQNALLKVLEEPPEGTYVFINLESLGGLLPTFLSRVKVLDLEDLESDSPKPAGEILSSDFINSDLKKRLSLTRFLLKDEDKRDMKELIKNLERVYYENHFKNKSDNLSEAQKMKKILMAKILSSGRGSSPKMLLEWLSCVL